MAVAEVRVPLAPLTEFVQGILVNAGVNDEHARITADRLIEADVRGVRTHGVFRLAQYVDVIRAGHVNLDAKVRTAREASAMALVDGDNALGQVSMTYAADLAADKAATAGTAWVGIRNGNHVGALSVYVDRVVRRGFAAIMMAQGQGNWMAPWGGVEPLLSASPIAFGVPAGESAPVVLDITPSVVAVGQVRRVASAGEEMPEGWMTDISGEPLTDPAQGLSEGVLLPIGGHKGSGLALMIGLMAAVMNGTEFGYAAGRPDRDPRQAFDPGHTIIVADPGILRDKSAFLADVDGQIQDFVNSKPVDPAIPVRVPGDRWLAQRNDAEQNGVPLDRTVVERLEELGRAAELEWEWQQT